MAILENFKTWEKVVIAIIVGFFLLVVVSVGSSDSQEAQVKTPPKETPKIEKTVEKSTAYKLASFLYKPGIEPQESMVQVVQLGLNDLKNKCSDTEKQLGDYIYVAYNRLKKKDSSVSILTVIDGISNSIPKDTKKVSCAEIAAAYVVSVNN